jgi:hypothetical protein
MANPCSMIPHYVKIRSPAGHTRVLLGCVEKETPMLGPAPADIRTVAIPPGAWATMTELVIKKGNTEFIPNLPPSLLRLSIQNNRLRELPPLPASLEFLEINTNQLTALPTLPVNLTQLDVKKNQLTNLPTPIPTALEYLHVTHNNLEVLPSLAGTELRHVGLGFNNLRELPDFPDTLRVLGFINNQVSVVKNLPNRLRTLVCSNNPISVFQIENLTHLDTLIATNCGLTELPLLPGGPGDDNNNEDGDHFREDRRDYYFDNNPLTPEFAAIYQRFRDAETGWQQHPNPAGGDGIWSRRIPESTRRFRDEILAEHQRLIALKKAQLGELVRFKRAPESVLTPALARLAGNRGPLNLISQFITGKAGPLEAQRLDLLRNQERMGAVPAGTADAAAQRIANVIANANRPLRNRERAKLYLPRDQVLEAKERYEAEVARRLEVLRIEAEKKKALKALTKFILWLGIQTAEARLARQRFELNSQNNEGFEEKEVDMRRTLGDFQHWYFWKTESTSPQRKATLLKIASYLKDPKFKEYMSTRLQSKFWGWILDETSRIESEITSQNFTEMVESYPQLTKEDEIAKLKDFISVKVAQLIEMLQEDPLNGEEVDNEIEAFLEYIFLKTRTTAAADEVNSEVDDALSHISSAIGELVEVVNDDDEEDEAMRQVAQEMGALVNPNGDLNNNEEENEEENEENEAGAENGNNNQGGGSRKRKTRRNKKKNSRQTRRR